MDNFECYLLEPTGAYTSFHEGISSPIYRRVDTGVEVHTGWGYHPDYPRMDSGGMYLDPRAGLVLRTPGGDWYVDQPSSSGGSWTRTGELPKVSCTPSILFIFSDLAYKGRIPLNQRPFHGWLTDGILSEI